MFVCPNYTEAVCAMYQPQSENVSLLHFRIHPVESDIPFQPTNPRSFCMDILSDNIPDKI